MIIKRSLPPLSYEGRTYKTNYLWCSDGWTYDVTSMVRRQYTPIDTRIFDMTEEKVTKAVFSDVQYTETLEITVVSENPRVWIEKGTDILDMFEELKA